MKNRRILITAGPTHERIDAVRYLGNRSSGKLGVALAAATATAGWDVTLLLGPVELQPPAGVKVLRFESTDDLARLLEEHFPRADVLVMAAAVSDFRLKAVSPGKIERGVKMTLELEPTEDLVAACAAKKRTDQKIIAFALESPDVMESRAAEKLLKKNVDAIVANPLGTMGAEEIEAVLIHADGRRESPGGMAKADFARWLIGKL